MADFEKSRVFKQFVSRWSFFSPTSALVSNVHSVSVDYRLPLFHWGVSLRHMQMREGEWGIAPTSFFHFRPPGDIGVTVRDDALSVRLNGLSFSQSHRRLRFKTDLLLDHGRSSISLSLSPAGISASSQLSSTFRGCESILSSTMTPSYHQIGFFGQCPLFSFDCILTIPPMPTVPALGAALSFTRRYQTFVCGFLPYGKQFESARFFLRKENREDPAAAFVLDLWAEVTEGLPDSRTICACASLVHQKGVFAIGIAEAPVFDVFVRGSVNLANGVTLGGAVAFGLRDGPIQISGSASIDVHVSSA
jgi:hypothetical protein